MAEGTPRTTTQGVRRQALSVFRAFWPKKIDHSPDPLPRELREQINKRLTLNLLIQGSAGHAFLTAHHLIRDELNAIAPNLIRLYDKLGVCQQMGYSVGDFFIFLGIPSWFWRRTHLEKHPYHRFPLLARHGGILSRAAKEYLSNLAVQRNMRIFPGLQGIQTLSLMGKTSKLERQHKSEFESHAKLAASRVWGIDPKRLNAEITKRVEFGKIQVPRTAFGNILRNGAIGYGGVLNSSNGFTVVAKAWAFNIVLKELIKGTAELISLHGLNSMDDLIYSTVMDEADQLEHEVWMLQTGPELWRRFIAVLPEDRTTAEMLMHVARLDPDPLEDLMMAVVEDPDHARVLLRNLGQ